MPPFKQIQDDFGCTIIIPPYTRHSIYLRGTIWYPEKNKAIADPFKFQPSAPAKVCGHGERFPNASWLVGLGFRVKGLGFRFRV